MKRLIAALMLCGCGPAFTEELFTNSDGQSGSSWADADVDAGPDAEPDKDSTPGVERDGAAETGAVDGGAEAASPGDAAAPWCVPEPGAGWRAVLVHRGPDAVTCPVDYTPAETAFDGLAAPAATCGCTCGAPTGVTCPPLRVGRGCGVCSTQRDLMFDPQYCMAAFAGCNPTAQLYMSLDAPAAGMGGSCAPAPTVTVPPLGWSSTTTACAPTQPTAEGCGPGQVRLPERAGFQQCIAKAGDEACPGAYPIRALRYRDVVDTRACAACTCSAPTSTCGGDVYVSDRMVGGCAQPDIVVTVAAKCTAVALGGAARYMPQITGSCAPSTPTPTGGAVPSSPITVCCR